MSSLLDPELQRKIDHPRILRDDPSFAVGKMAAFQYLSVGVFIFLIAGFWQLQVQQPEVYSEQAERNRVKQFPIPAPRGKILDRDGRVIVDDHSSWAVMLTRESLKEEHLPAIAEGLHLDVDELEAKVAKYRRRPVFQPIIIKEELTPADLAFVESHHAPEFYPELELFHAQPRLYPQNGMGAHWIGYTGEISESELDSAEFAKYNPGAVIGKFGIERQYNDTLMGTDGERQVEVDNRGTPRKVLQTTEAIPGKNVQLTIDLDLQVVADLVMEGKKGAIVALDPRNGEILAMASRPTFDPNKFTARIKSADLKELTSDPGMPFLNRAIQSQLAPGSTFKPIMALTALETGIIDPQWTVHCAGGASFYGQYHRCWLPRGHGAMNLLTGLINSCDVYFYNVGDRVGIENIAHYAELAGLGRRTGVDLPGETPGVVPSPQRKIRMTREKWYAGETISVAIGQGDLQVSPLQLASAIGGLSRGGVTYTPHLLKSLTPTEKPRVWGIHPENVERIKEAMLATINIGTGYVARLPGIEVCGKTGSAQTASDAYMKAHHLDTNAWFVAYAPKNDPEIVIAALWEGAGHGPEAGMLLRDVMKAYFDKQARLKQGSARPVQAPGQAPIQAKVLFSGIFFPDPPLPALPTMTNYLSLRDYDWPMLLIVFMICGIGVLQIFSATIGTPWQGYWWKQIVYILTGTFMMWAVAQIDYHYLLGHVFSMYGVSVVALAGVYLFGSSAFGSTRWIALPGGLRLQVSEFAKLVIILLVARFLTELKNDVPTLQDLLKITGLVAFPAMLILAEPDLGTALTYFPILVVGVFLAGMPWRYWAAIGVIFLLVLLPVYKYALKDYQRARLNVFLGEDQDPRGSGYQVIQSKIAIGSGGMWGKGVTKGTQTRLRFLPVPDKDFIFSAFAEEHGFVGVMLMLSFYLILLMQIVQNAQTAPDRAGMYICMGVAALVLFHILVNVGMVIGRMPVTGIPLPLMSYGGSSIWSSFMMLGLVNNVRLRRFVN